MRGKLGISGIMWVEQTLKKDEGKKIELVGNLGSKYTMHSIA